MNLNKMILMNKFGWKQNVQKGRTIFKRKTFQEDHIAFKIDKEN